MSLDFRNEFMISKQTKELLEATLLPNSHMDDFIVVFSLFYSENLNQ